ncbi:MAG: NAD(P)-dependent alcohol dehydrogenase [Oscillospiraceae bacterium]|jgi:threonine dehydrogenase-like Zn-dependent dehydrogenase|nr:NAD(P)-dependent alcohol dehydrogenase [Oscillospiraceae bacterium]
MKGFAMLGIGKVGWIEKETPAIGPYDALVRPLAVSPCTSDVHTVWEGALGERTNLILGHEASGEIIEVGSLVRDFKPGDRVIVPAITPDWMDVSAQRGYHQHAGGMLGGWKFSNSKDGVFADFFHVNQADGNLAHLPNGINVQNAVMLSDMVPTGFHGADLAEVAFGETVAVIGIGPVGLMAVAGANLRGAARIFAVGNRPLTMDVAKFYGATDFVNYKHGPIEQQILEATDNQGVDKVIIAGGNIDTFSTAVKIVRPAGIIANVNYLGSGESIAIPRESWGLGMGHIRIIGGLMPGGRKNMTYLANLMSCGKLDVTPLLTHRFYGAEFIETGLELMHNKPADLIKPVVTL